jgi:DNA-binding response OmpR family regulator
MIRILLMEDNKELSDTVKYYLEKKKYQVNQVFNGSIALDKIYNEKYDLLLLDINVPEINGLDILKEIRDEKIYTPVIMLTSLNDIENIEQGFKNGCDDYIKKPFELKELYLRIETIIKRNFFHKQEERIEITKEIFFDLKNNELKKNGKIIQINQKESLLLKILIKERNTIVTKEKIYEELWGYDEDHSETSLRTYIKNLRKIIGKEKIVSKKSVGYKIET